jgi:hypothetical protein
VVFCLHTFFGFGYQDKSGNHAQRIGFSKNVRSGLPIYVCICIPLVASSYVCTSIGSITYKIFVSIKPGPVHGHSSYVHRASGILCTQEMCTYNKR